MLIIIVTDAYNWANYRLIIFLQMHIYLVAEIISLDVLNISAGCWWICGWCTKVCGLLFGVLSFVPCLYRLRLKKSERTAFSLPEQMSVAEMTSKPPTWFWRNTVRHASTFSSCKEREKLFVKNIYKFIVWRSRWRFSFATSILEPLLVYKSFFQGKWNLIIA